MQTGKDKRDFFRSCGALVPVTLWSERAMIRKGRDVFSDSPQSKRTVKVWHVRKDPQRQTDVNGTQPPACLHYRNIEVALSAA